MVKPLSLLGKGSQTTHRILAGVLFLLFSVILGNFPGLYGARAQLRERTPDEGLTLQHIHLEVLKENAVYRFNPEKTKGKTFSSSMIIKKKENKSRKLVPDKKNPRTQISSLLVCKNLYLGSAVNTAISYQIFHLALPLQGRDPPCIP